MPDSALSLVESQAARQRAGRVRLIERKTALDALAEFAGQARGGDGRLVLLEGEAGVGKSALLEQFTHDLPAARLLAGGCDGMFTPRPLGPLFDIAQQVHGRLHSLCRADASREELFEAFACARPPTVETPVPALTELLHGGWWGKRLYVLIAPPKAGGATVSPRTGPAPWSWASTRPGRL